MNSSRLCYRTVAWPRVYSDTSANKMSRAHSRAGFVALKLSSGFGSKLATELNNSLRINESIGWWATPARARP